MKRLILGSVVLVVASLTMVGSAWAESTTTICIPNKAGKPIVAGETGTCKNTKKVTYSALNLPGSGGLETLNKVLPHMKYDESDIGGKPTIQFSGVNVQLVNGEGTTESTNGEGNLVIGYDENPRTQTGSHNLVLGANQMFTSYGGILGGAANSITGPYASVSGGFENTASDNYASVSGGNENTASGPSASVSGGIANAATNNYASVSGGVDDKASGPVASVSGGSENTASGPFASVSGGEHNTAVGQWSSVSGGFDNTASGSGASVSGGSENTAEGLYSAIFGSRHLTATGAFEALP